MIFGLNTDETLLGLKVGFLVLLYLFVWVVVRTATRNVTAAPQESLILSPEQAAELRAAATPSVSSTLISSGGPGLRRGTHVEVSGVMHFGRGEDSDVSLDDDSTVSSRHATISRRVDGLWVEDLGSTNGTFVNGAPVTTPRLLQPGDVIRLGHTDLTVES